MPEPLSLRDELATAIASLLRHEGVFIGVFGDAQAREFAVAERLADAALSVTRDRVERMPSPVGGNGALAVAAYDGARHMRAAVLALLSEASE